MLFRMSEPNVNETCIRRKSEISSTFRWDSRTSGKHVSDEGDQVLAKGQEMGQQATKFENYNNCEDVTYYGISIPRDVDVNGSCETLHVYTNKAEALEEVKKHKKARFKAFKTRQEAVEFAVHGSEILVVTSPGPIKNSENFSPSVGEKPSPFKGPKAQDLVQLRKVIEAGNIDTFRIIVWDNPRYLVSSGDTPAILQEGSRYNALHVAAKSRNAEISDLILQTVSSVEFVQLLYGDDDATSCQDRANMLMDLYLNTPDKALNETPLHFAVKFGALSVVEVLLSYPKCDKYAKNKFGQTPRDIICSRVTSPEAGLRQELTNLLNGRYYVPVLRSEDNSVQPTVGEPFSPACPLKLKADPLSPRIEIRAYAGPMGREEAVVFRKRWKTPPRMSRTPCRTPVLKSLKDSPNCHAVRLQDTEKGLERVGRDLAQEFEVGWYEYWPFLDTFTNLASEDGLQKLEAFLKKRFLEAEQNTSNPDCKTKCAEGSTNSTQNANSHSAGVEVTSPISDLCLAFKACSLSDKSPCKSLVQNKLKNFNTPDSRGADAEVMKEDEALLSVLLNPGLSPFLYVEKSCQVFAKRISDGLSVVGRNARISDCMSETLRPEVRHLQALVESFKDDARFVSVDFNLIHSRIASVIASKLAKLSDDETEFVICGLNNAILSPKALESSYSDDEDMTGVSYRNAQTFAERQRKTDGEHSQIKCIAKHILSALEKLSDNKVNKKNIANKEIRIKTEEECIRIWSDAVKCSCLRQSQNFIRNSRKESSFKRRHNVRYKPPKESAVASFDGVTRRLTYEEDLDSGLQGACSRSGGSELNFRTARQRTSSYNKRQASDISEEGKKKLKKDVTSTSDMKHHQPESEDTSDDEYFTPPSTPVNTSRIASPCHSDDDDADMFTPSEGVDVFIQGDVPTKVDASVIQALEGSTVEPDQYPSICRWRHMVLLYTERERFGWSSPSSSSWPKERSRNQSTPESVPVRENQRQSSTPPQPWHKITGLYSPASPR